MTTALTVVYFLMMTTGNMGPTTRSVHDTWWGCEQNRMRIERETDMTGNCKAVSITQSKALLKPAPLPRPRVRRRFFDGSQRGKKQ